MEVNKSVKKESAEWVWTEVRFGAFFARFESTLPFSMYGPFI